MIQILAGDATNILASLPDDSIDCVVTSPPYWGLRDYGVDGQIGLEDSPEAYVARLVDVFREVRRVLKDSGTAWLNLGDSYASGKGSCFNPGGGENSLGKERKAQGAHPLNRGNVSGLHEVGLKPKDLVGIPWRVAFALQADGWWLRQDIIWCLSGGTWVYAWTQKGVMPMTVKDMARLDPSTVQLWNGNKWTRLLGVSKSKRKGNEIELVLRSGERISCTPTHRFPTSRGVIAASEIHVGDTLTACRLPEPATPKDCAIDEDAAWFAGLYLAEGSRAGDTIQIAGHAKEEARWHEVERIAVKFGGSATRTVDGNNMAIRVYGRVLNAIIDELVSGKTAHNKGFAPVVWRYSDCFIEAMLQGYLEGDGRIEGNRWRLGFCRNYNLERDLRTACARLGYALTLNFSSVPYNGRRVPTFRGEVRLERSSHGNEKDRNEVVEIRKARCREVYDIGVEDEPHTFALASGVLTHNSKPNPMPESVRDRCTKSHEYVFLLAKSQRYYFDAEAIKEPVSEVSLKRAEYGWNCDRPSTKNASMGGDGIHVEKMGTRFVNPSGRNKRDVWWVATESYPEAHFATFPTKLVEPMILAGCPEKVCSKCGKPWERVVERERVKATWNAHGKDSRRGQKHTEESLNGQVRDHWNDMDYTYATTTTGFSPTCACNAEPTQGTVLDPFCGSGTTLLVAKKLGRNAVGIELNPEYVKLAEKRFGCILF